ncbi:hypothetical protein BHM03_00029660 [Ensete ventricosum]|nr:hypothetical protein BHM03_00029660 [Ensete ventricosum]
MLRFDVEAAMTSIANSIYFLPFQSIYSQNHFRDDKGWNSANLCWFRFDSPRPKWICGRSRWVSATGASALDSAGNDGASVPVDGKGLDWERRINSFREMQEQRFNEVAINLNNIRDFERPSQSVKPHEQLEQDSSIYQQNGLINEGVDSSADNHQRN